MLPLPSLALSSVAGHGDPLLLRVGDSESR
jgi:hypothetical protein